jgi:3-phosphoshikimate 1-carboxyvinyltransferase
MNENKNKGVSMKHSKVNSLKGTVTIPGDKSISHRAVMFGAIANGTTRVTNFLQGADCLATIQCFQQLGIQIENTPDEIIIHGQGLHGLKQPETILDVGNSGTTIRLIAGILSAQPFNTTLTGDDSIQKRPMKRIIEPLTLMGAHLESIHHNNCAPLQITGSHLKGTHYISHVASAQVKSAILLGGLYADGQTSVTEPYLSRNHTEIMLNYFGASVTSTNTTAAIMPCENLEGREVKVPGDISSAAYFIAAGLLVPGSEILIKNVGINPTRDGILKVCHQMGGDITLLNKSTSGGEVTADILVRTSTLKGTVIEGSIIPTLIDEIPIIAIMASMAEGTTIIKDAQELKVKESNRLDIMVENLTAMGVNIIGTEDGMIIQGGSPLQGTVIDSKLDHRIAMSFTIAGLLTRENVTIKGRECVEVSYPDFYEDLETLIDKG